MFRDMQEQLQESFTTMMGTTVERIIEIVPQMIFAFIVLLVGAIVAQLARKFILHVFEFLGLDKLASKVNIDRALRAMGFDGSISRLLGFLIYWTLVLVAFLMASEVLGFEAVSDAIARIVAYLPRLIVGLIILVMGLILGRFLRDVVSTSLARAGITASAWLGTIVQTVIILIVCVVAVEQIGFDVSVVTTHMAVILGVLLVSAGLAIALSIRPFLEEVFLCRQVRQHVHKGDHVSFEDVKGTVFAFTLTSVIIRDGNKDVIVPARQLFTQRFTRSSS